VAPPAGKLSTGSSAVSCSRSSGRPGCILLPGSIVNGTEGGADGPMTATERQPGDTNRIFADHYDPIYRVVRGLVHDASEARDLTQEAFIKAYQALPAFRGESTLRTWLVRIAQNVVLDHFRRVARERAAGSSPLEDTDPEALAQEGALDPSQVVERRQSDACVQRCMDTLPAAYRQAVALHDMAGLTSREIATLLGVSVATVKIRLHRGRARLRSTVERHCDLYRDERNVLACRHRRARGER
jgi:RNA polymerase sigma-70 factor, ECF subfamily